MQITINLGFKGQCEAAFKFYEQCLGAEPGPICGTPAPMANNVPAGWQDKIMHGSVKLGDLVLMGGDVAPEQYESLRALRSRFRSRASMMPSASFASLLVTAGS